MREKALTKVLHGQVAVQSKNGSKVAKIGPKKYVELAREKTDKIFVVIVEFGDERHPDYPDLNPDPRDNPADTFNGPLHNQIAEPDRLVDNTTIWQADYGADHYRDLYFSQDAKADSVANYFEKQSSGRYSVTGEVSDWVKVRYNEARYGRNDCGQSVCRNAWRLIADGVNAWVAQRKAAGASTDAIKADLAQYDTWDRYDFDGDGDFNEPDGYIDHFQIVHAGVDEATGGGVQGEDAIWSHRWYAFGTDVGRTGPPNNKVGGTEIGDTGMWVGDYTMQPENGGLGVFAHEYAHDLGLPDEYDTTGQGENSTGFWTLMSSGSYLGPGKRDIGGRPGDLSAWDKLQLGWLKYDVAYAGQRSRHTLGPAEFNTDNPQAVAVVLPEKKKVVELADPPEGDKAWWSTMGDNLDTSMTREIMLPAGQPAQLSFSTWYDIEEDFDYAYVEVDDGGGWKALANDITDPGAGNGITGSSGGWVDTAFDLSPYAGKTVKLRFHYRTDTALTMKGFLADAITVTSGPDVVFADGAEEGANGWTLGGFEATNGTVESFHPTFYVAAHRSYVSYDKALRTGPYNFGFPQTRPDFVEHFPYQDGLLVWYWDTSQNDNNVSQHPGEGLILPVDAHPQPMTAPDESAWRTRIQTYDATFGLDGTDAFTLHLNNVPQRFESKPAVSTFDDSRTYWFPANPESGVNVANTGTALRVISRNGARMAVEVGATTT